MRSLLQQQAACECPAELLGGISAGGWVALSLFIGMFIGSTCTLLIQCWRRRRELRYMDKGTTVLQSIVMMQALPASRNATHQTQQPLLALPSSAALPPSAPASVQGSTGAGAPPSKYFSPLNTNKGHGSVAVVTQLSELRSSMHLGSDNGGDTHSVAASDQQAPRDKNGALAGQAVGAGSQAQRVRDFSQHGMRLQPHSSQVTWGTTPSAAQGGAPAHSVSQGMVLQGSVVYGALGTQLPQEVSSSMLSADDGLQAEDSSPMAAGRAAAPTAAPTSSGQGPASSSPAGAKAGAGPTAVLPSPRQQAQLPGSPAKGASSAPQHGPSAASPTATTATDIEEEYEESDLDDDWKALLGGVDARLKLQGTRTMNARERAVAIKKLLVATGTRGVEFALNSTLQEVLSFRQIHGL